MGLVYRGHKIEVKREQCLAGYKRLYYSIFRISDLFECVSGSEDSAETVPSMIAILKERIDGELAEDDPWGERSGIVHA